MRLYIGLYIDTRSEHKKCCRWDLTRRPVDPTTNPRVTKYTLIALPLQALPPGSVCKDFTASVYFASMGVLVSLTGGQSDHSDWDSD